MPPDAAFWRLRAAEVEASSNVVSIRDFVSKHKSHVKGGEHG